jgi:hypothetical protein
MVKRARHLGLSMHPSPCCILFPCQATGEDIVGLRKLFKRNSELQRLIAVNGSQGRPLSTSYKAMEGVYSAESCSAVISQYLSSGDVARCYMLLRKIDNITRVSCDVEQTRVGERAPHIWREFCHVVSPCFPLYLQVLLLFLWRAGDVHLRGHSERSDNELKERVKDKAKMKVDTGQLTTARQVQNRPEPKLHTSIERIRP